MIELTPVTFLGLFVLIILAGHQMSKTPLESLGRRPMGDDLWSWFFNFILNNS